MSPRSVPRILSSAAWASLVVASALAACDASTASDGTGEAEGIVVVNSNFTTATSITLLDRATGELVDGNCLDSGTKPPGYTDIDQSLTSGMAYIDVSVSPPVKRREQAAAVFGGRALGAYSGIANDGALGFAVTAGDSGDDATVFDRLWSFSAETGQATLQSSVNVDPNHGLPARDIAFY